MNPAEADCQLQGELHYKVDSHVKACIQELSQFLEQIAAHHVTPKRCEDTNIHRMKGGTYNLPPHHLQTLFLLLEACRREGVSERYAERQGTARVRATGIMLDFDVAVPDAAVDRPPLTDVQAHMIATAVAMQLGQDFDFESQLPRGHVPRLHIVFTARPHLGRAPKRGFHVLVPGLRVERAYKRLLIDQLKENRLINRVLAEMGAPEPGQCLDVNSAHVPVLLLGSGKLGTEPYQLAHAFEVDIEPGCPVMVRPTTLGADANLVAELSLVETAAYLTRAPAILKQEFVPRPEVLERVAARGAPAAAGFADNDLEVLLVLDHDARYCHALLDILPPEYAAEYGKWRNVIFALASKGETYRPLADWFSAKCPEKYSPEGVARMWESAQTNRDATITDRSIAYWARQTDPVRFLEVNRLNVLQFLKAHLYEHEGRLEHIPVANALQRMFGYKFVSDSVPGGTVARPQYVWYEFVSPDDSMRPGEVWKWRLEPLPDGLWNMVHTKIDQLMSMVIESVRVLQNNTEEENKIKYLKRLMSTLKTSRSKLQNVNFIDRVVSASSMLFRRRGFHELMDSRYDLLGVANGVLQVADRARPACQLLTGFHGMPVCKFTPLPWAPFDPVQPWTRIALGCVKDIVVEPDARDWILFHAAQALFSGPKEGFLLMWEGGGANGKTSLLRAVAECLGPYANKFNIELLCNKREDPDRPNSAVMVFKHCNYMYCEESNRGQELNPARLKEIIGTGKMTGRDLNTRQETFRIRSNAVIASQFNLRVPVSDHGTWRRMMVYRGKITYTTSPSGPFERLKDPRYINEYLETPEYLAAWLSILSHYYNRLQREYGGLLENVPCPTIARETEVFRISQDTMHRWLCQNLVRTTAGRDYGLPAMAELHKRWYESNVDNRRVKNIADIISEIENSALGSHLKVADNGVKVLHGYRIIEGGDVPKLEDGEQWFGHQAAVPAHASAGGASALASEDRERWWDAPAAPAAPIAPAARVDSEPLDEEWTYVNPVLDTLPRRAVAAPAPAVVPDTDQLLELFAVSPDPLSLSVSDTATVSEDEADDAPQGA